MSAEVAAEFWENFFEIAKLLPGPTIAFVLLLIVLKAIIGAKLENLMFGGILAFMIFFLTSVIIYPTSSLMPTFLGLFIIAFIAVIAGFIIVLLRWKTPK